VNWIKKLKLLYSKESLRAAVFDLLTIFSFALIISLQITIMNIYSEPLTQLATELNAAQLTGDQEAIDSVAAELGPAINNGVALLIGLIIGGTIGFAMVFSLWQKRAWKKKVGYWKFSMFNMVWMLALLLILFIEAYFLPEKIAAVLFVIEALIVPYLVSLLIRSYSEKKFWRAFKISGFNIMGFITYLVTTIVAILIFIVFSSLAGPLAIIPVIVLFLLIFDISRTWVSA
jgi:hypothetical protein